MFFKNKNYQYSLSPPSYKNIEEFILSGKTGYCSHFAAAFTFMARSVGLPSRVVFGYQGGEFNPFDQSITVRELDGHAWVEIYFKKKGWIRFDPTSIVAPGRINYGATSYYEKSEPYFEIFNYKISKSIFKFKYLRRSLFWPDSLNSKFSSNMSNFDKEKQQQFLNIFTPKSLTLGTPFAITLSTSLFLFWFFFQWFSKPKLSSNERKYKKFVKKMKKEGVDKLPYETAISFRDRCLIELNSRKDYINLETNQYIKYYYQSK